MSIRAIETPAIAGFGGGHLSHALINASSFKKYEVFKTSWYFNRGGRGLTYDTAAEAMSERYDGLSGLANPIIAQGCAKFKLSHTDYLAFKYYANVTRSGVVLKAGKTDMCVIAFFKFETGEFCGYVLLNARNGQGIAVRNESDGTYVYAQGYNEKLAKYKLPESFDGSVIDGEDAGLDIKIRGDFNYNDGRWVVMSSSEGSSGTPYSRTLIVYDDEFNQCAEYHVPSYRIGYTSNASFNTDPTDQRNFMPHTQGIGITSEGIVLFQGGSSNNPNSDKGNANCGSIVIGCDGEIVKSSLCKIIPFMKQLEMMVGSTISSSENEGGFVDQGRVYAFYVTNVDKSGEGFMLRVIEEYSSHSSAIDFSSSAWIQPQVELGGIKEIPSQSKTLVDGKYIYSYTNPISGAPFRTFDDILKFILFTGLNEFAINTTDTGILSLNGNDLALDDRSFVRITRWTTRKGVNTATRLFYLSIIRYGATHVSSPESSCRNLIVETNANGEIIRVFEIPSSFGQLYVGGRQLSGSTEETQNGVIYTLVNEEDTSSVGGLRYLKIGATTSNNIASFGISSDNSKHVDIGSSDVARTRIFAGTGYLSFTDTSLTPSQNNTVSLGQASRKYSDIFVTDSAILTSDEREKTNINEIPDEILDAWKDVEFRKFIFKSSLNTKGDSARLHVGVIAQQVRDALLARGIDASKYGFFCHDSWNASDEVFHIDESGNKVVDTPARNAGDVYSIRYVEALIIEAAYQRRRADRLEQRINDLEKLVKSLKSK